ncbi:hypothetical protein BCR34DRAFT_615659 [Clohesyomyces aquaticus]|uniref:Uncharacterized protein n=1 Tax=Clohesyomyces aquaticus TaxID=1231657 RepID=A0A1Y1ZHC9_9PLEO|nr:hypothetical protein BCR34DRAFT_615659 [Clohesyomyces aquaticus]
MAHYHTLDGNSIASLPDVQTDDSTHEYTPLKGNHEMSPFEVTDEGNTGTRDYYEFSEWKWEILAWILGTAIIAATVAILITFNGSLVEKWPLPIRINPVVAFLAQVAQSALLMPTQACIGQLKWSWFRNSHKTINLENYDAASRGPLGSALLIFGLSRKPRLVHLGALITIFMLVFSTFFQQAVQIRLRLQEFTGRTATTPRLVKYMIQTRSGADQIYSKGYLYSNDDIGADLYITNKINSGLLASSPTLSDVRSHCPGEQCNWDPYKTLAICYSTEDVSSQLITITSERGDDLVTLPGIEVREYGGIDTLWTSTIFGNGASMKGFRGQKSKKTDSELKNPDSNLGDLAHIYLAYQDQCLVPKNDSSPPNNRKYWRAFKGTIQLCLQTLQTYHNTNTSASNETSTTVIQEHRNLRWNADGDPLKTKNANWTTKLKDDDKVFSFPLATAEIIGGQLATSLNFTASIRGAQGGDNYLSDSIIASNIIADVLGDPTRCVNSTDYHLGGFDKRLNFTATTLTNAFRVSANNDYVTGTTFHTVQFIHVQFPMLAPPAALFAAITLFFLATVIRTTKIPVWKSSQLAVLYTMHEPERLGLKSTMEKEAETMNLRFRNTGNWQLEHD